MLLLERMQCLPVDTIIPARAVEGVPDGFYMTEYSRAASAIHRALITYPTGLLVDPCLVEFQKQVQQGLFNAARFLELSDSY